MAGPICWHQWLCIGLLAVYLIGVLKNRQQVVGFTISLMVLYIALYIIVGAEDFAMLMGASLTFAVLAITMLQREVLIGIR